MNNHNILYDGSEVWSFGCNFYGQLGLGFKKSKYAYEAEAMLVMTCDRIKKIACGGDHTFILKNDGCIYSFGHNYYGQLGLGDDIYRSKPTLMMIDPTVNKIVCGMHHTFILKDNKNLYCFGHNDCGQLGLSDNDNRTVPTLLMTDPTIKKIVCGADYTFILKNNGDLYCFGSNHSGQLGLGDAIDRTSPTLLMTDPTICKIVCGAKHTFIIKSNGDLYFFGDCKHGVGHCYRQNTNFDIMHKTNTPKLLTTDVGIKQIACGERHTFILKDDGDLYCIGGNNSGQLGIGSKKGRTYPELMMHNNKIRKVVCGHQHTFILKSNGKLYSFGHNNTGQLGLGNNKAKIKPTLMMIKDDLVSINGKRIKPLIWTPAIYPTLSICRKNQIKNFLCVCYFYKQKYNIDMVKYMRHMVIGLLF